MLHDARFSNHQGRFLGPCPHEGSFCTRGSPRFVPILPSGGRVAPSVLFPLPAAGSPRSLEFTLGFTLGPAVHGDFSLAGNLAVDTILVANAHHSCVRRLGVRKDGAVVVILEDDCVRTAHVCHILSGWMESYVKVARFLWSPHSCAEGKCLCNESADPVTQQRPRRRQERSRRHLKISLSPLLPPESPRSARERPRRRQEAPENQSKRTFAAGEPQERLILEPLGPNF